MNSVAYQTTLIQEISKYLLGNLQFIVESQPEQFEEAAHFELRNISNEVFAQSLEQLDGQFRDSEERKQNMAHVPLLNQSSQYSSWIRNVISPH